MEQPVVVSGLVKSFGAQQVLKGIDLAVNRGEILAILGKSGTGKSVLLRLLIGLESRTPARSKSSARKPRIFPWTSSTKYA